MTIQGGNKIVFNTGVLYAKMAITILISLYATRLILDALGTEDYGIYVIVGGVIAMLGFLNITMATSTQRHLSYSLGKDDIEEVKKVFANSIILHFLLGLFLVLIFEVFGQYILTQKLTISPERIASASTLFHLVVASTFITILTVPYDGILNAKENMLFISIIGVVDSLLRLVIAYSLLFHSGDKLVFFGFLMMLRALLIIIIKGAYCTKKYSKECKVHLKRNYCKTTMKELYSFAGWNLAGILAYIFREQGIAVVLNLFFNTAIVAAYGIANQVNTQLRNFSGAMIQAIQPQMVKDESSGDRERMLKLSIISSRFSFFIFAFIALPLYFQMEFFLEAWLKEVPVNAVIFCRLIIVMQLMMQFRLGITIASHAIGNIKEYQLFTAPIQLMALPVGYLVLKLGYQAYSIMVVVIIIELITIALNIVYFKKFTGYSPFKFVKDVIFSCLLSLFLTYGFMYFLEAFALKNLNPFLKFILLVPATVICYTIIVYSISLDTFEKEKIRKLANKLNFFH